MDPTILYYVFLVSFLVGGTILACQFLLTLIGLGGDHGADGGDLVDGGDFHGGGGHDLSGHDVSGHAAGSHGHDTATAWFLGMLSFKTIVAALTFFGLAGLASFSANLAQPVSLLVAVAAGVGALLTVAWVMRSMSRLHAEGTVRIERSVGKQGSVYLTIPGNKAGCGKVHLNLQNRTVEYKAMTAHSELRTGSKIVVVGVIGSDTVEVVPMSEAPVENPAHV